MTVLQSHLSIDEHQMHVSMELARLDEMQAAIWDEAVTNKDTKAIDTILKIMNQRAKYLGLEKITPTTNNIAQIMLVSGTQQDFIAALKAGQEAAQPEVLTGEVLDDENEEDL